MVTPILNPIIPYCGQIPGGLLPGKMVRIHGITCKNSDRFNINLQVGPQSNPRDDTALHISVRLDQGCIVRNTFIKGSWGQEERSGSLPIPIAPAQSFEILILVDPNHYKIAVNGRHYCEFVHRIPYNNVFFLLIDGDVTITLISWEGPTSPETIQLSSTNVHGPPGSCGPPQGNYRPGYAPPPPGPTVTMPMPTQPPVFGPGPAGFIPSPYPSAPLPNTGSAYPGTYPGNYPYPTYPPITHNNNLPYPNSPQGHGYYNQPFPVASPTGGYKKMKESKLKKAMKYGLPIAGAGLGTYVLSEAIMHHRSSSSCSSSSSSSSSSD